MAYDNRDSGCNAIAAVVLLVLFLVGVAILVLGGVFFARKTGQLQVQAARADVEIVAEQQARAVEVELATERDQIVAESNPVSEVVIALDADGNISFDGGPVDLEGLRQHLPNADSSQFVLHVDNQCSFESVSRVLSVFDEVGIERPTFAVSGEE
jgi:biopolymer transport protein ExbD